MTDPFAPPEAAPDDEIVEYTVALRVDQGERSFWDTGGTFLVPRFLPRCVCCNAETGITKGYDPGESNQLTGTFELPVCPDCTFHVSGGRFASGMLALAGGIGGVLVIVGLAGWTFFEAGPYALVAGLVGVGISVGGYRLGTWRAVRHARHGHHSMFEVWVAPGFTGVRTTNRRLVDDLLVLHGAAASILQQTPR